MRATQAMEQHAAACGTARVLLTSCSCWVAQLGSLLPVPPANTTANCPTCCCCSGAVAPEVSTFPLWSSNRSNATAGSPASALPMMGIRNLP